MSLIDELKALHADSLNPSPGDDERRDSSENFNFIYALADAWPNILAVVEAADQLAFQYEGLLEWISDKDCECCHCDDHDKLVDILKEYRKAKIAALDGVEE